MLTRDATLPLESSLCDRSSHDEVTVSRSRLTAGTTGLYEEPTDPEVLLKTDQDGLVQSVTRLTSYLHSRGLA
ncbi:hypothetical protein GCM10010522_31700 [Kribbella solani]